MLSNSKISNFLPVLALSGILTSGLSTSSWAMEKDPLDLPIENVITIVRGISTECLDSCYSVSRTLPDLKILYNIRETSSLWKAAADDIILRDQLLHIGLSPDNFEDPILGSLAPLVRHIYLAQWNPDTANQIETALSKWDFSNVLSIWCSASGVRKFTTREIGETGTISLANGLKQFSQLQKLNIQVDIGEKGGKYMGELITYLPELQDISITGNLGPEGTVLFSEGLNHKNLIHLNLIQNGVGDRGCTALANKLTLLPSLQRLRMDGVLVTNPGGQARFMTNEGRDYFKAAVHKNNPKLQYKL